MQYGKAIVSILSGNTSAGNRVYPLAASQESPFPYIVYRQIGSTIHNTLNNTGSVATVRVQLDLVAKEYLTCQALESEVRNLLVKRSQGSYGTDTTIQNIDCISIDDDQYEADNNLYIISADYEIREVINNTN